jgi:hypothetical protein
MKDLAALSLVVLPIAITLMEIFAADSGSHPAERRETSVEGLDGIGGEASGNGPTARADLQTRGGSRGVRSAREPVANSRGR